MKAVPVLHKRRRGRLTALALAAVVAAGAAATGAFTQAHADTTPDTYGEGILVQGVFGTSGKMWLGRSNAPQGAELPFTYCVQMGGHNPGGSTIVSEDYLFDPQLAWIFEQHQHDPNMYNQAALSYLSHMRHESTTTVIPMSAAAMQANLEANAPQYVKDLAAQYLRDAEAEGGPFAVGTGVPDASARRTGVIRDIGIRSDAGRWSAGNGFTIVLNGPAVFDATGTSTYSGTSQNGPITLAWTATGNGEVTYKVTFKHVPRTTLTKFGASGNIQDTITYGNRPPSDPEEITAPGQPFPVIKDFLPQITTGILTSGWVGDVATDEVTVIAQPGDVWATYPDGSFVSLRASGTAYWTPTQPSLSANVPTGAREIWNGTLDFAGPGTKRSSTAIPPEPGFVTYVWSIMKAQQEPGVRPFLTADVVTDFGIPGETSQAKAFTPAATTLASNMFAFKGDRAVDTLEAYAIEGEWGQRGGRDVPVIFEATLYGPFETPQAESPTIPPDAPVVGTVQVSATGPGSYTTPDTLVLPDSGTYTWVTSVIPEQQGEYANVILPWQSAFFDDQESTTVRFELAHSSHTREYTSAPGGLAFDVMTTTGYPSNHGAFNRIGRWASDLPTAEVTLYGPLPQRATSDVNLERLPILWQGSVSAANGTVKLGFDPDDLITFPETLTHPSGDHYVFVYHFAGDDRVAEFTSDPGDLLEQYFIGPEPVRKPRVTTLAQQEVQAGSDAYDTAYPAGDIDPEGQSLSFELWQLGEGDVTTDTLVCTTASVTVYGTAPVTSPTGCPTAKGQSYYFREKLMNSNGVDVDHYGSPRLPNESVVPIEAEPPTEISATPAEPQPPAEQPILAVPEPPSPAPAVTLAATGGTGSSLSTIGIASVLGGALLTVAVRCLDSRRRARGL